MDRYLIKPGETENLIVYLSNLMQLPEIIFCLAAYSLDNKYTFELIFRGNKPSFRFYLNKDDNVDIEQDNFLADFPYIELPEDKLKYFLKMIYRFGFNKVNINLSERFQYRLDDENFAVIQKDTFVGDILYINKIVDAHKSKLITSKYCKELLDREKINSIIKHKNIKSEFLFSSTGVINSRIHSFANMQGINLSYAPSSLALKLGSKSNDYSIFEDGYKMLCGHELTDHEELVNVDDRNIPAASIIIPYFNSETTIEKVLEAINSQNIPPGLLKIIEVIVVDDGSVISVTDILRDKEYIFDLKIIRLKSNSGSSFARNVGLNVSKYEKLIFIDSDILMDKNYLKEHLLRLRMIPNAVFFSLKRNIDKNDNAISLEKIKKGLAKPKYFNDKRLSRDFKASTAAVNDIPLDGHFEILNETDNLKLFGNGRIINGFDLPSAVVSHNLVVNKEVINSIGGFNTDFQGWGLEDAFAGAKLISSGNFIIPVLSCGVYHINHPPRSGSESKKDKEYWSNLKIYKNMINKRI